MFSSSKKIELLFDEQYSLGLGYMLQLYSGMYLASSLKKNNQTGATGVIIIYYL